MRHYRIGPFELRGTRLILAGSAKQVAIGPKVVETLAALIESGADVAAKEAMLDRIWPTAPAGETNLAQNVCVLRRLFREHGAGDAIETLPGVGYRLTLPAQALGAPRQPRFVGVLRLWPPAVAALIAILCIYPIAASLRSRDVEPTAKTAQIERLYALGRYYWNLRTSSSVLKSVKYFAEVIEREPESPLGYAGLADAYATIGDYCYETHRPKIYFARAAAYARQALLRDPAFAPAHATLGFLFLHDQRPDDAIAELRRSLTLDPAYAPAHEWYGIALALRGRHDAARSELTLASQLAPLSVASAAWLARIADRDGRFADARSYAHDVR
ncbi:MAG TPA: winged helix-turn-helix domain-containing protein, partial [Candidatus Cybelea sp.]|nr:winged helix-turn-helix domain-containing protein [Candidatus Cybelea sp.]